MPFFSWLSIITGASTKSSATPWVITLLSVLGSVLLFILVRIAMRMYREEEFTMEVRRMAFLDKWSLKLEIHFSNQTKKEKEFRALCLYGVSGGSLSKVAELKKLPIAGEGSQGYISSRHEVYDFRVPPFTDLSAVIDFDVPKGSKFEKYQLGCISEKGKLLLADIELRTNATQTIHFRRG